MPEPNMMDLQDWGAIGEVVAAIAVVVSIVYLAAQIRSNTRATKASASFDATHSWATLNEQANLCAKRSSWAAGLILLPFYSVWWKEELELSIYSDAFVEAINSAHAIGVRMIGSAK